MVVVLCSLLILMAKVLPAIENEWLSILQFIFIILISFYMANKAGMAKVKVIFTNEAIIHIWERRYFLSWEKDIKIPLDIVDNYIFQEDRYFDSFTINLTNKTRYKIYRLNFIPIKDDFRKLLRDYPYFVNDYRNGMSSDTKLENIKVAESIYALKSFKWIFYIFSAGFLLLLFTKVFDTNSEITWSSLGVIGSGLLFYWTMIKENSKSN